MSFELVKKLYFHILSDAPSSLKLLKFPITVISTFCLFNFDQIWTGNKTRANFWPCCNPNGSRKSAGFVELGLPLVTRLKFAREGGDWVSNHTWSVTQPNPSQKSLRNREPRDVSDVTDWWIWFFVMQHIKRRPVPSDFECRHWDATMTVAAYLQSLRATVAKRKKTSPDRQGTNWNYKKQWALCLVYTILPFHVTDAYFIHINLVYWSRFGRNRFGTNGYPLNSSLRFWKVLYLYCFVNLFKINPPFRRARGQ